MKYKMSDEFAIPWTPIDYQNHIVDSECYMISFADMHQSEKEALCEAVNNYDRLTAQVEELKGALMLMSDDSYHSQLWFDCGYHKQIDELLTRIGEDNTNIEGE